MMSMAQGNLPTGWKIEKLTFQSAISNAAEMATYLASACQNKKYSFGILDRDMGTNPDTNNTCTSFLWSYDSTVASNYQRYRQGVYQNNGGLNNSTWNASYDLIVQQGATFTVFYYE